MSNLPAISADFLQKMLMSAKIGQQKKIFFIFLKVLSLRYQRAKFYGISINISKNNPGGG